VLLVGGSVKYLRSGFADPAMPAVRTHANGFTFDAGVTIRGGQKFALGLVGYNLHDLGTAQAPVSAGGGISLTPTPGLLICADGLLDFTTQDPGRGRVQSFMGGAEYALANRFGLRAGGGYDGDRKVGYGALGVSLISEVGALDVGARQDLSGSGRSTFIGFAGRLFVPSP
jgi:hypothetical protein